MTEQAEKHTSDNDYEGYGNVIPIFRNSIAYTSERPLEEDYGLSAIDPGSSTEQISMAIEKLTAFLSSARISGELALHDDPYGPIYLSALRPDVIVAADVERITVNHEFEDLSNALEIEDDWDE